MAKCVKCNAEIPDGQQYCSECEEKENKESYLDNLLNSVEQDKMDAQINRFAKRKSETPVPQPEEVVAGEEETAQESSNAENLVAAEINSDTEQEHITTEGQTISEEEIAAEEPMLSEEMIKAERATVSGEMLLTDELDEFERMMSEDIGDFDDMSLSDAGKYDILKLKDHSDAEFERMFQAEMDAESGFSEELQSGESQTEDMVTESELSESIDEGGSEDSGYSDEYTESLLQEEMPISEELALAEESEIPEDLLEAVMMQDEPQDVILPDMEEMADSLTESEEGDAESAALPEADNEMDNDILDLINSMNSPESEELQGHSDVDEDLFALEDIPSLDMPETNEQPGDIEGVFSDTLRSVDMLSDEEQRALMDIPMLDEEEAEGGKKKKKKERKPGLFKRIFGNIPSNRSEEEIARMKEKIIADAEAKERAEEEKKQKAAEEKEAKEKKAAEDKAAAAVKKQEQAKIKAEKKAEAARLKKDAKARKKQELQELIDEIEHDEGKINRLGASIVFIIFAAMAVGVLIGTRVYAYSLNMQNAQENFEIQRYNDAYQNVYGMDIKAEDEDFYLQVMTVMYTYKQLNSYQNYYAMGEYPHALDSLLKGLQRYDKYAALAAVIGIEDDMNFVRDEILEQLKTKFQIEEREAVTLSAMADREAYTDLVYQIATQTVADSK